MLGLGCENSRIDTSIPCMKNYDSERVKFLFAKNEDDEHESAMKILRELAEIMREDKRVPCDSSALIIGLKCGGSNGLSGIMANPAISSFPDILIAQVGSTILTEVPEMFGAEKILTYRCKDESTYRKTVEMINGFKNYYASFGLPVFENPSPENKAGGIATL